MREFHPDWYIEEIGVDRDHVQVHMTIPPKYVVSEVGGTLKSMPSQRLKEKFLPVLKKTYWASGEIWARGFFASPVGVNETTDFVQKNVGDAVRTLLQEPCCNNSNSAAS